MEGSKGETLSFWDIELNVTALPEEDTDRPTPIATPKSQRSR